MAKKVEKSTKSVKAKKKTMIKETPEIIENVQVNEETMPEDSASTEQDVIQEEVDAVINDIEQKIAEDYDEAMEKANIKEEAEVNVEDIDSEITIEDKKLDDRLNEIFEKKTEEEITEALKEELEKIEEVKEQIKKETKKPKLTLKSFFRKGYWNGVSDSWTS